MTTRLSTIHKDRQIEYYGSWLAPVPVWDGKGSIRVVFDARGIMLHENLDFSAWMVVSLNQSKAGIFFIFCIPMMIRAQRLAPNEKSL